MLSVMSGCPEYVVPLMHEGQVTATPGMVRRLIASQFPQWANDPVTAIPGGTDHAMFRIGPSLLARFPLTESRGQPVREARWLPVLSPLLPLEVPAPLGLGDPGEDYPWQWTVVPWITGSTFDAEKLEPVELLSAAQSLADFVRALHCAPAGAGPPMTAGQRGAAVQHLDEPVRRLIGQLGERIDGAAVLAAWAYAMSAPTWPGDPVWLHTDLGPGNVIMRAGRVAGVIDFGLGVGDPAPDLLPAWHLFEGASRDLFLRETGYDEATQARALAWLLAPALQGLVYYQHTRPDFVSLSERHIKLALQAHRSCGG